MIRDTTDRDGICGLFVSSRLGPFVSIPEGLGTSAREGQQEPEPPSSVSQPRRPARLSTGVYARSSAGLKDT